MNHTSMVINKILIVACAISGMFCAIMAAWYLMFPVEKYEQQVQQAQVQLTEAEADMQLRIKSEQASVDEVRSRHEEKAAQLSRLQADMEIKEAQYAALQAQMEQLQNMPQAIAQLRQNYGDKVRQLEEMIQAEQTDVRICYLTFDDGPNNLTASILEKFKEHNVYATFFTIGTNSAPLQAENLRAEMMGGHTIANHTYSHYIHDGLYSSIEEFKDQVMKQDEKVFEATGFHMNLFRFPSGSVMCPFLEEAEVWLEENGYQWIDWNATAWDSGFHSLNVGGKHIARNVMSHCRELDIAVVLCHDFNYSTYEALDIFIPQLRELGFVFLPLFPQSHMLDAPLPVV